MNHFEMQVHLICHRHLYLKTINCTLLFCDLAASNTLGPGFILSILRGRRDYFLIPPSPLIPVDELGTDAFYSDKESALRALQVETEECEKNKAAENQAAA